jgi:hypothetical protein
VQSRFAVVFALLWVAAGASSCGEFPEAPWVLRDEPRVLGYRVEVVEVGPNSAEGLLPIPADRVRSQPMPGDVIEISAFIASADGETPVEQLDPVWLLCPAGACLSVLNEPGARDACAGAVPERVPCVLPSAEKARLMAPLFDPSVALQEQAGFLVALVGHTTDDTTTQDCLDRMGDRGKPRWDGCLAGYFGVSYGPTTRLLKLAFDEGIEVRDEEFDAQDVDFSVPPLFNPESVPLLIAPDGVSPTLEQAYRFFASPDTVTALEPGKAYRVLAAVDPRDGQTLVGLHDDGVTRRLSFPGFSLFTDTPDTLEFRNFGEWVIHAPETPGRFELFVLLSGPANGSSLATFEFEVSEP